MLIAALYVILTDWHTVIVGRNLTHGYVILDSVKTEGLAEPGFVNLDIATLLYLGNYSMILIYKMFSLKMLVIA